MLLNLYSGISLSINAPIFDMLFYQTLLEPSLKSLQHSLHLGIAAEEGILPEPRLYGRRSPIRFNRLLYHYYFP